MEQKKSGKKLVLSIETIRHLDEELTRVRGASKNISVSLTTISFSDSGGAHCPGDPDSQWPNCAPLGTYWPYC